MGIPIAADLGASGGYTLPADYSLPPLALTLHEVLLLRLALSGLAQLGETPFKQERESLLAKVLTLLPHQESEGQFQPKISLNVPSRTYPVPFLDLLLESAQEQQWVAVTYRSEKGVSQQTLLPAQLRTEFGLWYCEAYSYERQETRVYRVDRFLDVRVSPTLPQLERPVLAISHLHPSFPEICIHLTDRGFLRLEREPYLGPRLQQKENGEGCLNIRLRLEEYDWLVRILLTLGTDAKVLAPEGLRIRVQQAAQEIALHYSTIVT